MRTTKRFTLAVLERFEREGRGIGILAKYTPWHRVGRGDPASRGRSHLIQWRGRPRELLSDLEWIVFLFVTMLGSKVVDVREQFPLALRDRVYELGDYDVRYHSRLCPGTLALAKLLDIKHPRVRGEVSYGDWVMTTDLLVTTRGPRGRQSLLAISCKYDEDARSKRAYQLLSLERQYWIARGVEWLLVTPALFEQAMALTMRRALPFAFGQRVHVDQIEAAVREFHRRSGRSLTELQLHLAAVLGDLDLAQRAYWQAVWIGAIPIDLRQSWRPHLVPSLLSPEKFWSLNPIASRRTSWNAPVVESRRVQWN